MPRALTWDRKIIIIIIHWRGIRISSVSVPTENILARFNSKSLGRIKLLTVSCVLLKTPAEITIKTRAWKIIYICTTFQELRMWTSFPRFSRTGICFSFFQEFQGLCEPWEQNTFSLMGWGVLNKQLIFLSKSFLFWKHESCSFLMTKRSDEESLDIVADLEAMSTQHTGSI